MIKEVPVALRNRCPQWMLLGNHDSSVNLQALVFFSKREGEGSAGPKMDKIQGRQLNWKALEASLMHPAKCLLTYFNAVLATAIGAWGKQNTVKGFHSISQPRASTRLSPSIKPALEQGKTNQHNCCYCSIAATITAGPQPANNTVFPLLFCIQLHNFVYPARYYKMCCTKTKQPFFLSSLISLPPFLSYFFLYFSLL